MKKIKIQRIIIGENSINAEALLIVCPSYAIFIEMIKRRAQMRQLYYILVSEYSSMFYKVTCMFDYLAGATQGSGIMGQSGYLEGFTAVKSLGSASASYMFVPSPSIRFLPPSPLQLPTGLTSESPPLAHLLHSKGSAIPLSTGFVVSRAVPSMRKDSRSNSREEWPSVLSVGLVDYYGGSFNISHEKMVKSTSKSVGRGLGVEARDFEIETHLILERVAAELHALSWMTVSPAYLERRTSLPFHCDMVMRLRRLLHFADKEFSEDAR